MNRQLALAIQVNEEATLGNFNWANNTLLEQQLQQMLSLKDERVLYLWGAKGSGKSHILQACCQALDSIQAPMYLPLMLLKEWGPQTIEGVDEQDLICIDDIDVIANDPAWEEALFHLYNRIKDKEKSLFIVSANQPPASLSIQLADLRSRFAWGLVIHIHELNDEEKMNTLVGHALKRGFALPKTVAQFLLNRCSRNMHDLQQLLNRLDEASLAAHRKITIPFVKDILGI
jgi:DnaA family protein